MRDTRLVAIASFENTAPVIARLPKSILLEPAASEAGEGTEAALARR